MSDEKQVLIEKAFADGFLTALMQLEAQILSTYAKKVLQIDKAVDFLNASSDDRLKVLQEKVQLGSLLNFIGKLRNVVTNTMDGKPANEEKPNANTAQMDGGVILQ